MGALTFASADNRVKYVRGNADRNVTFYSFSEKKKAPDPTLKCWKSKFIQIFAMELYWHLSCLHLHSRQRPLVLHSNCSPEQKPGVTIIPSVFWDNNIIFVIFSHCDKIKCNQLICSQWLSLFYPGQFMWTQTGRLDSTNISSGLHHKIFNVFNVPLMPLKYIK